MNETQKKQLSDLTNEELIEIIAKTQKKKNGTKVIIAIILSCIVIGGLIYYNNNANVQQRVNLLYDEIMSYDTETEISKIYNVEKKLNEIAGLVNQNHLSDSYEKKYKDSKEHVEDLKAYKEVEKALLSDNPKDWTNIQIKINALKTEGTRAKIDDDVLSTIEERVRMWVLYNTLKYYEEYITNKYGLTSVSGVCESYYYTVPTNINKDFMLSVPETSEIGNVEVEGYGCITRENMLFDQTYLSNYNSEIRMVKPKPLQDSIRENAKGGFIVEYVNNELNDGYSWSACDFDVETEYKNGILNITLITSNRQETIYMREIESVKALSFK